MFRYVDRKHGDYYLGFIGGKSVHLDTGEATAVYLNSLEQQVADLSSQLEFVNAEKDFLFKKSMENLDRIDDLTSQLEEARRERNTAWFSEMQARFELAEAYDDLDSLARYRGLADTYDHERQQLAEQLEEAREQVAAYERAWKLPELKPGAIEAVSLGELLANEREYSRHFKERAESAEQDKATALAALREIADFLAPSSSGYAHNVVRIARQVIRDLEGDPPTS